MSIVRTTALALVSWRRVGGSRMGESIIDATRRFVADLDERTLASADASAREHTRLDTGREMRLQEALELLTAAKIVAVGDDFDRGEAQGLRLWLTKYDMPDEVQRHLLGLDVSGFSIEELSTRLRPDCVESRRLFWVVAALASFEGLRSGPRTRAEALGSRLGLSAGLTRVLVEEAQLSVSAVLRGDEPLIRRLRTLRHAIFELGAPS